MAKASTLVTGIVYGDTHGQYIDLEAEAVLFAIMRQFQPANVVHVGDAVDCYSVSSFDKDPLRKESLQDEIDAAREHLEKARKASPNASWYLLEGNHEDRLRRALWGSQGAMREIVKLREVQKATEWSTLLRLDALGIRWVPSTSQPVKNIFPKFIVKHGDVVKKWSGATAQGEYLKYGKSGASGHVHRLGVFFHRDWNGNHVWAETGCLCSLSPAYTRDPDWQQGFLVVTFEKGSGAFQIEPVYVHKGKAVWRDKEYSA